MGVKFIDQEMFNIILRPLVSKGVGKRNDNEVIDSQLFQ